MKTLSEPGARQAALERILREMGSVVIAYSGGVDSAYLAVVAHRVLGPRALAVTADSESLAAAEREQAQELARRFGFAHRMIRTREIEIPLYARNAEHRCYHSKSELFRQLLPLVDLPVKLDHPFMVLLALLMELLYTIHVAPNLHLNSF